MPDGNRRYARKEGISLDEAYKKGVKTFRLFMDFFLIKENWNELTLYIMAKYTYNRTDRSLPPIYNALLSELNNFKNEKYFQKNNLKLIVINHSNKLPKEISEILDVIEQETKNNKKIVRFLLGYDLETDEKNAFNKAESYDEFTSLRLISDIDLVIRTTEMRMSKGPVYAMEQAQMILLNKLNPELTKADLDNALKEYNRLLDYRKTTNPLHKI